MFARTVRVNILVGPVIFALSSIATARAKIVEFIDWMRTRPSVSRLTEREFDAETQRRRHTLAAIILIRNVGDQIDPARCSSRTRRARGPELCGLTGSFQIMASVTGRADLRRASGITSTVNAPVDCFRPRRDNV